MKKANSAANQTQQVDAFMDKLDHPFKAEVQLVREIIKNVNSDITEQIKWNAPSFSYKGESLVTFNLWEKGCIHLVFHNPMISKVKINYWKVTMTTDVWCTLRIRRISRPKSQVWKKR